MSNPSKCLVTGAAGFIGSHLVDALLARGAMVVGIDSMILGKREYLSSALKNPRFKFFQADLNDWSACQKIISAETKSAPFDTVWHLAANSDIRAGGTDPDVDLHNTFLTTHSILKLMREFQIPRIAFSSTSAIYGVQPAAVREDAGLLFPISNYGAMKLASEAAISAALESVFGARVDFPFSQRRRQPRHARRNLRFLPQTQKKSRRTRSARRRLAGKTVFPCRRPAGSDALHHG